MNILLPFHKEEYHPYLEELKYYSGNRFISWNMNHCKEVDSKIINIHWPEAIFNWREPTDVELDKFEEVIHKWKSHASLIYTKHDFERIKGTTPNFKRLFKMVEENADFFIHLGNYGKNIFEQKYPKVPHKVIPHPVFKKGFIKYTKEEARRKLKINKEAVVVIAPGRIRNFQERKLVLNAFRRLKANKKVLILTNMRNELEFDFRGRVRLQKFFDVQKYAKSRFIANHQPPDYLFNYNPMSVEDISLRMSAADVVLVPRIELLNSGIVFLGASYDKVVVGPRTGNITEQLKEQELPIFDPSSISSVSGALSEGVELFVNGDFHWKNMEKYQPEFVAEEYDVIFSEISKK